MLGSIKATAPASQRLAPVITVTTVIAIQMCPSVYITANATLEPVISFFYAPCMPCVNSVIWNTSWIFQLISATDHKSVLWNVCALTILFPSYLLFLLIFLFPLVILLVLYLPFFTPHCILQHSCADVKCFVDSKKSFTLTFSKILCKLFVFILKLLSFGEKTCLYLYL